MKKTVLLNLLIILVLIAGGIFIYFFSIQKNSMTETIEYSSDEFQTYLNEAVTLKSLSKLADKEEEIEEVCLDVDLEEESECELPYKIQILSEEPRLCSIMDYVDYPLNNNDCYYFLAYEEKELDLCKKIKEGLKKERCLYDIKREIGYEYTKLSECKEIPRGKMKDPCYEQVSSQLEGMGECEEFPEDWAHICYYEFASRTNNVSICDQYFEKFTEERISEEEAKITAEAKAEGKRIEGFNPSFYLDNKRSNCYNKVAWDNEDVDLCKSNSCIRIVAKRKLTPEICYKIESIENDGNCEKLDPENCPDLLEEAIQDCFEDVTDWVDLKSGGTNNRYWSPGINLSLY